MIDSHESLEFKFQVNSSQVKFAHVSSKVAPGLPPLGHPSGSPRPVDPNIARPLGIRSPGPIGIRPEGCPEVLRRRLENGEVGGRQGSKCGRIARDRRSRI